MLISWHTHTYIYIMYVYIYIHTYRVMVRSGAAGAEVPQTEHGKFESKFMATFVWKMWWEKWYVISTQPKLMSTNSPTCFFFSGSTVEPQAKLIFERQRCIQVGQCSCVAVGVWLQFGCLSFERSSRKQGQNAADPNHSPSSCCFEGVECSHVASCWFWHPSQHCAPYRHAAIFVVCLNFARFELKQKTCATSSLQHLKFICRHSSWFAFQTTIEILCSFIASCRAPVSWVWLLWRHQGLTQECWSLCALWPNSLLICLHLFTSGIQRQPLLCFACSFSPPVWRSASEGRDTRVCLSNLPSWEAFTLAGATVTVTSEGPLLFCYFLWWGWVS